MVLISLDHDLPIVQYRHGRRVEPGTGRVVADYLAKREATCPVIVHSSNVNEGHGMMNVLKQASWPATRVNPFGDYEWVREVWAPQVQAFISQGWVFVSQGEGEAE